MPPAFVASVPPMWQLPSDAMRSGKDRPDLAAVARISPRVHPASAVMASSRSESLRILRIRSRLRTTGLGGSRAIWPPTRPVPPPKGTTPTRSRAQRETILATSSVDDGLRMTAARPWSHPRGSRRYGESASGAIHPPAPTTARREPSKAGEGSESGTRGRRCLAVLEVCLALFGERGHAFLLVLGRKKCVEQAPLQLHTLSEPGLEGGVDSFLGGIHREAALGGDGSGHAHGLVDQGVDGITRLTSPERSASLASIMRPVRAHVHGLGLADSAREPLGSARSGNDAEIDLGLAEFCVLRGEDQIAHHRDLASSHPEQSRRQRQWWACGCA